MIILNAKEIRNSYSEIYILRKFSGKKYLSIFTKSALRFIFDEDEIEEVLAIYRKISGRPQSQKAIKMEWANKDGIYAV